MHTRIEPLEKRKVCIFCQTWQSGGIEAFINNVLQHINMADFEIDIVVEVLSQSVFTDGLKMLGVTFRELSGSIRKPIENYRMFSGLMDDRKYDILHLNVFQALPFIYLSLAKWKGIPTRIAHSHNTMLRRTKTRMLKIVIHKTASIFFAGSATDLWACSENAARFMFPAMLLKKKGYRFIPNGIDLEKFRFNAAEREAVRKQLQLEGSFVIGNVGRLCYQKNQAFLLDVFAEILKENPKSCLLLVGDGEDKPQLVKKAQGLGILDRVLFYGLAEHAEHLLWAMDVFVLPSHFEGLPVVGVEAQASGLPCVFSDAVTRECALTDATVFLPLGATPFMWAKTISQAKNRISRTAAAKVVKNAGFDIETVAKQIESSYLVSCHH